MLYMPIYVNSKEWHFYNVKHKSNEYLFLAIHIRIYKNLDK
jgi:hypothetical protein